MTKGNQSHERQRPLSGRCANSDVGFLNYCTNIVMSNVPPLAPSRPARTMPQKASTTPNIAPVASSADPSAPVAGRATPQLDEPTKRLAIVERELERTQRRADARGREANALRQHVQELEPQVRRLEKELDKRKSAPKPIWKNPCGGQHEKTMTNPTQTTTADENIDTLRTRVEAAEKKATILQLRCDQLERERASEVHSPVGVRDHDSHVMEREMKECDEQRVTVAQDLNTKRIKKELEVAERRIRNSIYVKEAHENLAADATAREREANERAAELERRLRRTKERLESKERRDTINGLRASCKSNEEAIFIAERELRAGRFDPELNLPVNTAKRRQLGRLEQRYHRLQLRHKNQSAALVEAERAERTHDDLRGAATSGDIQEVTILLQSGISVNVPDQAGLSAFHYVCGRENAELVRVMLDAGGDVLDGDGTMTGLNIAGGKGHVSIIKTLLHAGADVSARDSAGGTPLHTAVRRGHVEASRVLLEAGSDCNAVDQGTNTPLHTLAGVSAEEETVLKIASLLLEWGASVDIKNSAGLTPVSAALEARSRQLVLTYRDFLGEEHHSFNARVTSTPTTRTNGSQSPEATATDTPTGEMASAM